MPERFVSDPIRPIEGTMDTARMARGEPGLPAEFRWGSRVVRIARVLRAWHETGPCHHGSRDQYVRKHWFEVQTDAGERIKLYFERQPRSKTQSKRRWWLFSVDSPLDTLRVKVSTPRDKA